MALRALVFGVAVLVLLILPSVSAAQSKIVTAAEINGVYAGPHECEIRILALGHQRVRVQIFAARPFKDGDGNPSADIGTFDGIARIDSNVAILTDSEYSDCGFRLTFMEDHRIKVAQRGRDFDCGIGAGVSAAGIYRRTRSGKPKFEEY